jgi:hypothetical protein
MNIFAEFGDKISSCVISIIPDLAVHLNPFFANLIKNLFDIRGQRSYFCLFITINIEVV